MSLLSVKDVHNLMYSHINSDNMSCEIIFTESKAILVWRDKIAGNKIYKFEIGINKIRMCNKEFQRKLHAAQATFKKFDWSELR